MKKIQPATRERPIHVGPEFLQRKEGSPFFGSAPGRSANAKHPKYIGSKRTVETEGDSYGAGPKEGSTAA